VLQRVHQYQHFNIYASSCNALALCRGDGIIRFVIITV